MKILMCNSFYYLRGGSERCFFDLMALLQAHGHEVIPFSMNHERNEPTPYDEYFISSIDFPSMLAKGSSLGDKFAVMERVIYSREARRKIERLISDTKPDIAHIHGIASETSPSILPVLKAAGIPIVQTLHDYRLICPNTSFVSHGEVCERCKTHRYDQVVRRRCKRNSLPASLLAGMEMTIHKLLQIYERNVDVFITPSQFLKDKLREYDIKNEIVHLPNFASIEGLEPAFNAGDYILFYGRLVGIKGVFTLLQAMIHNPEIPLIIAGRGDDQQQMERIIAENNLKNVSLVGHLDAGELFPLIRDAAFTVVPSEWYENYSMTVIESLALGTPVIGSRIGGIPEQIEDGWNGLLFEPGNVDQLARKINQLFNHKQKIRDMGQNGRKRVEEINSPDRHYQKTMAIYQGLLKQGAAAPLPSA